MNTIPWAAGPRTQAGRNATAVARPMAGRARRLFAAPRCVGNSAPSGQRRRDERDVTAIGRRQGSGVRTQQDDCPTTIILCAAGRERLPHNSAPRKGRRRNRPVRKQMATPRAARPAGPADQPGHGSDHQRRDCRVEMMAALAHVASHNAGPRATRFEPRRHAATCGGNKAMTEAPAARRSGVSNRGEAAATEQQRPAEQCVGQPAGDKASKPGALALRRRSEIEAGPASVEA